MSPLVHLNLARGYRGGERQTELLIRELAVLGWRQRLVCRRGQPLAIRCRDVAGLDIREAGFGVPGALLKLRHAGLVHSHEGRGVQAAWLAGLRGVPYLITRRVQNGPRRTWLNRRMYRAAAGVVAISPAVRQAIAGLDPRLAVTVIFSAGSGFVPDPPVVARLRRDFGGTFVVGHVGALDDSAKGQRLILELARRFAGPAPQMRFVLVGSGKDEKALAEDARGVPNVVFAGQVDNVGDYLAAFDLFIYPSRHEGLGSVLLDAMAAGLPIVASRAGGIPDVIVDGTNGLLCPIGDADALAQAIRTFAEDDALRARVAAANRLRAQDYSAAAMAGSYAALYRELASQGRSRLEVP